MFLPSAISLCFNSDGRRGIQDLQCTDFIDIFPSMIIFDEAKGESPYVGAWKRCE